MPGFSVAHLSYPSGSPEGSIFDRKTAQPVVIVSEGDVIEIEQVSRLLPGVSPLAITAAEDAKFPPPPGGLHAPLRPLCDGLSRDERAAAVAESVAGYAVYLHTNVPALSL